MPRQCQLHSYITSAFFARLLAFRPPGCADAYVPKRRRLPVSSPCFVTHAQLLHASCDLLSRQATDHLAPPTTRPSRNFCAASACNQSACTQLATGWFQLSVVAALSFDKSACTQLIKGWLQDLVAVSSAQPLKAYILLSSVSHVLHLCMAHLFLVQHLICCTRPNPCAS